MSSNGIPILGQTAITIPAQQRLNAAERIAKAIDNTRALGLRFARIVTYNPLEGTDVGYLLLLDAIHAAGCRLISLNEHVAPGGNGQPLIAIHAVFQLPDSLFVAPVVEEPLA